MSTHALEWATEELVRHVEVASTSGAESAFVDHLEGRLGALDIPVARSPVGNGCDNLIVGQAAEPELAVVAHMDTIRPHWPWSGRAEVRGHEVWGLGAADDKAGVVACLLGWLLAREAGVPVDELPVALGFTVDEEEGGSGSTALAPLLRPRRVVALEPMGLDIAIAGAGTVEAKLKVHGRTAHGSLPERGDNAVVKAAHLVVALDELTFLRAHDALMPPAIVVLQLHGGSELHVVPDRAEIHVDARIGPGLGAQPVYEEVCALAARFQADVEPVELAEPWLTDPSSDLVQALLAAVGDAGGHTARLVGCPAWTDAHSFVDLAAAEVVVFGPGAPLTGAHTPDEHIDMRDVVACARVLAELLTSAPWQGGKGGSATSRSG